MSADTYIHGTCGAYERRGCRCETCRTAHNERVARNRAERLASGRLTHGTRSAYDCGCRCEQCLAVRQRAHRREYRPVGGWTR